MKCMFFSKEFIDNYSKNDKFLPSKFIPSDWGVSALRNFHFKNVGSLARKDLKSIFKRWLPARLTLKDKQMI